MTECALQPYPILQPELPVMAWMDDQTRRLPGLQIIPMDQWLLRDKVFAEQMALRDQLMVSHREAIFQQADCFDAALDAPQELLATILDALDTPSINQPENLPGYKVGPKRVTRPDGVDIDIAQDHPLVTAGRLVQEDFVILRRVDDCHIMAHALVCFPASWQLSQKIGRTLLDLHQPVSTFDQPMAARVERMLTFLPDNKLGMRANFLIYTDPSLHQPRAEGVEKPIDRVAPRYIRVERQTFRRLPKTGAMVFSIHTSVVSATTLPRAAFEELARLKPNLVAG